MRSSESNEAICCNNIASKLLEAMDRTVPPCDDFFQYACGTWNRLHVIPEDSSATNKFEVMGDGLELILKNILEKPPDADDNNATVKAKMFYRSCTNICKYK